MANICDFKIHVRGTKKAALMLYAAAVAAPYEVDIDYEGGTDDEYIIHFSGSCKWGIDAYCEKRWNKKPIDLSAIDEETIRTNEELAQKYSQYKMKAKSGMFQCEVEVIAFDEEEGISFDHYKDGELLDEQYTEIDWDADPDLAEADDPDEMDTPYSFDF